MTSLNFAKILGVVGITLLLMGLSGYPRSCVGPAEFTSGLPDQEVDEHDERLNGWWYSVGSDGDPTMMLRVSEISEDAKILLRNLEENANLPPEETEAWTNFTSDILKASLAIKLVRLIDDTCWMVMAYAVEIDGVTYYDAKRPPDGGFVGKCEDYTGNGETPGHIIFQAMIDGEDRLFLRFVRNSALQKLSALGTLNSVKRLNLDDEKISLRTVDVTAEDGIFNKYPVMSISSEDLVKLIRSDVNDELFTLPFGPFHRLRLSGTPVPETGLPWEPY